MKKFAYLFVFLFFISCATQPKVASVTVIEKYYTPPKAILNVNGQGDTASVFGATYVLALLSLGGDVTLLPVSKQQFIQFNVGDSGLLSVENFIYNLEKSQGIKR